jgi:hypothetical protein
MAWRRKAMLEKKGVPLAKVAEWSIARLHLADSGGPPS